MTSFSVSCVVDRAPKFYRQAFNWVASLQATGTTELASIIIFHVGTPPPEFSSALKATGVEVVEIAPVGHGLPPPCNKLQQFQHLSALNTKYHILTDADLVFLEAPGRIIVPGKIRAKIVDRRHPRPAILHRVLRMAGFGDEALVDLPDFAYGHQTHPMNCNGGLYVVPHEHMEELGERWIYWARRCFNEIEELRRIRRFFDQLGFMLAMIELQLPFEALATCENFPTHFQKQDYAHSQPAPIRALHYHNHVDEDGFLLPTGEASVDVFIDQANEALRRCRIDLPIAWSQDQVSGVRINEGYLSLLRLEGESVDLMLDDRGEFGIVQGERDACRDKPFPGPAIESPALEKMAEHRLHLGETTERIRQLDLSAEAEIVRCQLRENLWLENVTTAHLEIRRGRSRSRLFHHSRNAKGGVRDPLARPDNPILARFRGTAFLDAHDISARRVIGLQYLGQATGVSTHDDVRGQDCNASSPISSRAHHTA